MILGRRQLLAGFGATLLAGCGNLERALITTDAHPDGYPTVEAVRWMGDELARQTDGRIAFDLFSGGQLGDEKDTLELTILGGIDVNRINLAPLNSIVPETVVPALPFLFNDLAHMRRALDGPPGEEILASLEPHGLIGLAFFDSGSRSFYTSKRAIRTPDDLRGLKIRVQNSDLYVATMAALGAAPTPMAYGEVYTGLLQGVIDGAENNEPSYESSRHFEAAPIFSPTMHILAPEVLVMARHRWERLTADDQALIRATADRAVIYMRGLWDAREQEALARLRAAGVTFVPDIDREAFRARVRPVWDRFLSTATMRRLAADMQAMA